MFHTRPRSASFLALALAWGLAFSPESSSAQDLGTWYASIDGALIFSSNSGLWNDVATWDCACIPLAEDLVVVLPGHAVQIASGASAYAAGLSVVEGGAISLDGHLSVTGDVIVGGEAVSSGEAALTFSGNSPHMLSGGSWQSLNLEGEVTVAAAVQVAGHIEPGTAILHTGDSLTLLNNAGFGPIRGQVNGAVTRLFSVVKTSTHTQQTGLGLASVAGVELLNQLPDVSLRNWVEAATGYMLLQPEDTISGALGLMFSSDTGTYALEIQGSVLPSFSYSVTYTEGFWSGFHHVANPLTATIDWNSPAVQRGPVAAATYAWSDEYNTYMAQVGGYGLFGHKGHFAPGAPFWVTASEPGTLEFGVESAITPGINPVSDPATDAAAIMGLQIASETATEQTLVVMGAGSDIFDSEEDAVLNALFRGKNYLDLYTRTSDSVATMVNLMDGTPGTVVPLWVKSSEGTALTLTVPVFAAGRCILIEDLVTGQTFAAADDLAYDFVSMASSDTHRFNLYLGAEVSATTQGASCLAAADGSLVGSLVGSSSASSWGLIDGVGESFAPDSISEVSGEMLAYYSGLSPSNYALTVDLSEGCPALVLEVELTSSGTPIAVETVIDHIGCNDDTGGAELSIDGAGAPFDVAWSHGATGTLLSVEQGGLYSAIVTDAVGCSELVEIEIFQAPPVEAVIYLDTAVVTLSGGEVDVLFGNATSGATSYHWDFGDGNTSTDPIPLHTYTAADYYVVALNAWNDLCADTYQAVLTVQVGSAVEDLSTAANAHRVAELTRGSGLWTVHHPVADMVLELYDLTGRLMDRWTLPAGQVLNLRDNQMPRVALLRAVETGSGKAVTWKLAH